MKIADLFRRKKKPVPRSQLPRQYRNWICMVCKQIGPDRYTEIAPRHRIGVCADCRDNTEEGLVLTRANQSLHQKPGQMTPEPVVAQAIKEAQLEHARRTSDQP